MGFRLLNVITVMYDTEHDGIFTCYLNSNVRYCIDATASPLILPGVQL